MAVTIIQAPPVFTFSGNFIPVKLQTDNLIEEAGQTASNYVYFPSLDTTGLPAGLTVPIRYGNVAIDFKTVAGEPDDSGTQLPSGVMSSAHSLTPYFAMNFQLQRDFLISDIYGTKVYFEAKDKRYGLKFTETEQTHFWVKSDWDGRPDNKRPDFGIYVELWCENADHSEFEMIFSKRLGLTSTGASNIADVDFSEILHSYMEASGYDMPAFNSTTPLLCKKTCRKYYFRYCESWGDPVQYRALKKSGTYTVVYGKLSYVGNVENNIQQILQPGTADNDRFLRQGSDTANVLPSQPHFLYFFNGRAEETGTRLKVNFYTASSPDPIVSTVVFDLLAYRKYAFNMRLDQIFDSVAHPDVTVLKYDVWLESSTGSRISQVFHYEVDYTVRKYVRYFLYLSSWGSIDTLMTYGKAKMGYEISSEEAAKTLRSGYSLADGERKAFDVKLQDKFKVPTGWMKKPDLINLRDFLRATEKFRYHRGRMLPIALTSKSIDEMSDSDTMYKEDIEYQYLFADDAYTERTTEEPEIIEIPPRILPVYFGAAVSIPLSDADLLKLLSQDESIFEFNIDTGLNKIFVVAMPYWKQLHEVYDSKSEEFLTAEYKLSKILINSVEYNVYTMELAVAYTEEHIHEVTIKSTEQPGIIIDPEKLLIYFGASASEPLTEAAVKSLTSQPADQLECTLSTGSYKIFTIAVPDYLEKESVDDTNSEEDLTSEYKPTGMTINGNGYTRYTMKMAISYSTNHEHLIKLRNVNN